ncbi:mechanosensitive ion channel domain-containing protein [Roseomonas xinghualingensis]|uniref:mechanosensitive ion channel domain-containing protein n=1 Tax=Roseomonas xinghualingensis TaxID=2986475 RepID=UPI0021F213C2|nr:mechanosensitive ion channel domain-containing protein [Roseomonas sp. SXEYE001]MCV4208498.1 mechanosensitive ion channel [Roseomonas sp. SXEYE001]
MRLTRPILALLALLLSPVLPVGAASAQTPALPQAPAAPVAAPQGSEAERLLGVLRDDAKRGELIRNLEALSAASRAGAPASAPANATPAPAAAEGAAPAPAPAAEAPAEVGVLAPNTLGAQLLMGASQRLAALSDQIVTSIQALTDLPNVVSWASGVARDPVTQVRVLDASWKLVLLFGMGLLAEWSVWRLLARWRDRLDTHAPEQENLWTWFRRIPYVLARLVLDLLPIGAFAVISYGMIRAVQPLPTTELVLLLANNAYIAIRAVMLTSRMLFSPNSSHLRLVPLHDETAAYITIWLRRIVAVLVVGWAVAEAGLLFGVPWAVYDGITRLALLIASLFLIIVVMQNRHLVAERLRAPELKPDDHPDRSRRMFRALRDRLAEIWHVLAILYLLALWCVWALEVRDGFERLLRGSAMTLVVLAAAKGADYVLRRALERGFRITPDLATRYPGLEQRANRYLPVLKGIVSAIVVMVTLLVLLEGWGIDAFDWFRRGALGARVVRSLVSIGLTVLAAVTVWEVMNAAIQRRLVKLSRDTQAARSARIRTLLPMLRTALLIIIMIFVALNVLSEIGVNVAPLIAGAGVVGVAIGFGSQTLVKDVITGMFLLLEDAVAVGDTVTLGTPQMTGVVEQLSIRSIRLRAMDGAVHIVPFSAVTSVTNMTRDFAFAVVDVALPYGEDMDRVTAVMREIAAEMRQEPRWASATRDEIDVMGVDKLLETGVVVRARMKTDPSQRWPVTRELNRRIQARFEAEGIKINSPWRKMAEEEDAEATAQAA